MSLKPSDAYACSFTTKDPTTFVLADADTTPTATAVRNGGDDAGFVLTVTRKNTGSYSVAGTIPPGYAPGDIVDIRVAATVGGKSGLGVVDRFVLDGKRVSDLHDPAPPANWSALAIDTSGHVVLAAAGLDQISVESGVNARQALSPILAGAAGVVAGAGTGTVVIRGGNVATTRITAACDSAGNRTSVTLTLPS